MTKKNDGRTGVRVIHALRGVDGDIHTLHETIERLRAALSRIEHDLARPLVTVERYAKRSIIIRTLLMVAVTFIMTGALLATYGGAGFTWLSLHFLGYIGCSLYSVIKEHRLPIKPKEARKQKAVVYSEAAYYVSSMVLWVFFLGWFFLEHTLSHYGSLLRIISFLIMHTALTNWRRAWWACNTLKLNEERLHIEAQLEEALRAEIRLRGREALESAPDSASHDAGTTKAKR